jgi:hypothetical protein
MMWKADPTLCSDCGLAKDAHAAETKCPFGPGRYLRTAKETHFHGLVDEGRKAKVSWACYVCSAAQTTLITTPIQPSDLRVHCNWRDCNTVNLLSTE